VARANIQAFQAACRHPETKAKPNRRNFFTARLDKAKAKSVCFAPSFFETQEFRNHEIFTARLLLLVVLHFGAVSLCAWVRHTTIKRKANRPENLSEAVFCFLQFLKQTVSRLSAGLPENKEIE
jgi:hypothetical protein